MIISILHEPGAQARRSMPSVNIVSAAGSKSIGGLKGGIIKLCH